MRPAQRLSITVAFCVASRIAARCAWSAPDATQAASAAAYVTPPVMAL